jgi:hypothetical protein
MFSHPKYLNGCLVASEARGNERFSTLACGSVVPFLVPLRVPETSTREVCIRTPSAEIAGFEVVSEPFTASLINLRGCLQGLSSTTTATQAAIRMAYMPSSLEANCSFVEFAYVAAGPSANFVIS